jgi:acyl transferase domain-containing protein
MVPCLPAVAESAPATVIGNGRLGQGNIQQTPPAPKLLVWSAADKGGIQRIVDAYRDWWSGTKPDSGLRCDKQADFELLADLAFTLGNHRSHLLWRSWAVVDSPTQLSNLQEHVSAPTRSSPDTPPRLGFVFTGQGAQWFAMGRELMRFDSFRAELIRAGCYLEGLGCSWSVMGKYRSRLPLLPTLTRVSRCRRATERQGSIESRGARA